MIRLFIICGFLGIGLAKAQLTPPGLDGAKTVGWVAVGFSQTLSQRWSTTVYAGTSTQSSLDNYAFWQKPAISVLNQEWAYQFAQRWQLVLGGSFRFQDLYEETPPYEPKQPAARNEIRAYTRLFFRHTQGSKLSWAHSFRPEYRLFYTPNWQPWPNPFQIRLRWKSQLTYPLNGTNTTQFIAANEVLTTLDRIRDVSSQSLQWGDYRLSEDRLSMFIRRVLKKPALNVDFGLMHQFWWDATSQKFRYTTYFSVDFLFRNPFKKKVN
jgi:hypothetical protein